MAFDRFKKMEDYSNETDFGGTEKEILYLNLEDTSAPLWVLICYYTFILVGICINFGVVVVLLRRKRNGVLSSVLQLAIVDIASTYVGAAEIWAINNHSWVFSPKLCPFYLGSEVLLNTFVLYLTICINFHIISTVNLHIQQMQKDSKNPLTSYNEDDESEDCIVTRSDNHILNRNVVIDYRRKKNDISILFPSILVWFICLSLSIPEYSLSNAISVNSNCTLCTVVDTYYRYLLQNLLMVFRIAIPLPLLLLSLLVLIKKFYQSKYSENKSLFARKTYKVQLLLFFGLNLSLLYVITSVQRQLLIFLHVMAQELGNKNMHSFKMSPLENITCSYSTNLISAMAYYGSSTLRSILYVIILPEVRLTFKKIFVCCKSSS